LKEGRKEGRKEGKGHESLIAAAEEVKRAREREMEGRYIYLVGRHN
jgi:hypothetical protein